MRYVAMTWGMFSQRRKDAEAMIYFFLTGFTGFPFFNTEDTEFDTEGM